MTDSFKVTGADIDTQTGISETVAKGRWRSSVRGRLAMLTAALLIPAALLTILLLWQSFETQNRAAERQLGDTARALSLAMDRQIGQSAVLISTLASSTSLIEGDDATFRARAAAAIAGSQSWIILLDEDDRQLVNTRWPIGAPLPAISRAGSGWTPIGGDIRLWNLFTAVRRGPPVVVVSKPVRRADGSLVELSVVTPATSFQRLFADQELPSSWTAVVLDARYLVVARSRGAARYVGTPASGYMRAQMSKMDQAVMHSRTLDGIESVTAYSRSPNTQWTFLVAVPASEFLGSVWQSLLRAALAGVALLGGGFLLARLVAGGIARPIERLAAEAATVGRGDIPAIPPSGLIEADAAGAALTQAAVTIHAREEELRGLAQTLEARVADRTRELAEATEELVQAQKMEALGRLTGGMAHDFNNLLTAIIGNLDLLARQNPDERTGRRISAARQAADRGARLTAQLLAFSRRQHLMPAAVDINRAVSGAAELLGSTLGTSIRIRLDLDEEAWPAMADPTQLDLILLNLAINGRDAMPAGGVLTLTTRNAVRTEPPSNPEQPGPGEYVAISVADSGKGMTAEVRARIFEPFFTTKAPGQGTGLGLPQVLGVVKQLGGGVDVESAPEHGTRITLYLPRADGPASLEDVDTDGLRDVQGLRVLVVDDDPAVRAITASILTEIGCEATETDGPTAALAMIDRGKAFDVALVDYAMPDMNGAALAAEITQRRPRLPVLLMTGFADTEVLAREWKGVIVKKPFDAATLSRRLALAAERRRRR